MKSWLAKMKLSAALDAGPKPSPSRRPGSNRSDELRRFEQELTTLDATLRGTAPRAQAPASLHHSIMRAVQTAKQPAAALAPLAFLRWMAVPAGAALVLLLAWHGLRAPANKPAPATQSLTTAAAALEAGGQIALIVPSAVVAPLSDELQRPNRDLDNAAQYLLASLP